MGEGRPGNTAQPTQADLAALYAAGANATGVARYGTAAMEALYGSGGVQASGYSNSVPADVNWQNQILAQMSQAGQLYGINPLILEAIGQEESGREVAGAGYNSAGYGGYFGLGAGQYPGGQIPVSELLTNSQQSFIQQAQVAASAFASYLQQSGGNVDAAESIYQTGKPGETGGGVALVDQYLAGASPYAGGSGGSASIGTGTAGTNGANVPSTDPAATSANVSADPAGTLADVISAVLGPYGLDTPAVAAWATAEVAKYAADNMTTTQIGEQIGIDLQAPDLSPDPATRAAQQAFQSMYPGLAIRNAKGLPPITVSQYQQYQDSAMTLFQAAGMVPYLGDAKQVIGNLIGNDVGTPELTDRIQKGYQAATQANPETLKLLQEYYPTVFPQGTQGVAQANLANLYGGHVPVPTGGPQGYGAGSGSPTNGALAAYYLNPANTQATLDNQIAAAQIGTEGVNSEFGGIPVAQAQMLQQAGVTQQTARTTFTQLSKLTPLEQALPGVAPTNNQITQPQLVNEGFFGANQQLLENVESNRKAPFSGGGGYAQSAKGVVGAGGASTEGQQGT